MGILYTKMAAQGIAGFHTGFAPGGWKMYVDALNGRMRVSSPTTVFVETLDKFKGKNCAIFCYCVVYPIVHVAVEAIKFRGKGGRGEGISVPPPPLLYKMKAV